MSTVEPLTNDDLFERAKFLTNEIDAAFDGVTLGQGTTIEEAESNELRGDPISAGSRLTPRIETPNHKDWRAIAVTNNNFEVLYFMDPDGWRFHLPAFMTADLKHVDVSETDQLVFLLTDEPRKVSERLSQLTNAQRRCCGQYVEHWIEREFAFPCEANTHEKSSSATKDFALHKSLNGPEINAVAEIYLPYFRDYEAQRFKQRWLT